MPYRTFQVRAEQLLKHNGQAVYYTYLHDDINNYRFHYHFTTNPFGTMDGVGSFDVRDLSTWKTCTYNPADENARIKAAIRAAINSGELKHVTAKREEVHPC